MQALRSLSLSTMPPGLLTAGPATGQSNFQYFSGNDELSDTPARVLFVLVLSCGILDGCATVVTLTTPVLPDGRVW